MKETSGLKERGMKFPPLISEIKRDKTKINISFLVLEKGRANTNKREERRKEEEEEEEEEEDYRYGTTKFEHGYMSWVVWNLSISMDTCLEYSFVWKLWEYRSLVLD